MRGMVLRAATLAVIAATTILAASPARALPIFARRYGMSCTTCHSGGPTVLNEFGEAFRDNGYRIPGDDPSFVARPPVPLGNAARTSLFPDTMWPGELPGDAPFAFEAIGGVEYELPPRSTGEHPQLDPEFQAKVLVAGSLGPDFSVLA